jgi:hypothetical protein
MTLGRGCILGTACFLRRDNILCRPQSWDQIVRRVAGAYFFYRQSQHLNAELVAYSRNTWHGFTLACIACSSFVIRLVRLLCFSSRSSFSVCQAWQAIFPSVAKCSNKNLQVCHSAHPSYFKNSYSVRCFQMELEPSRRPSPDPTQ